MPLLSSIQGKIEIVALSMDESAGQAISTFQDILLAFEIDVVFAILVKSRHAIVTAPIVAQYEQAWNELLVSVGRDPNHNYIFVLPESQAPIQKWIQDYFAVKLQVTPIWAELIPASLRGELDYAAVFARGLSIRSHSRDVQFAGGNLLMVGERLLAGKDLVLQQGTHQPVPVGEMEQILSRAFDAREVTMVGTAVAQNFDFGGDKTYQPLFHIDLFVTPAGNFEGKEVLLVAQASLENVVLLGTVAGAWGQIFKNICAGLDEIAFQLEGLGFAIARIPVVFAVQNASFTAYSFNNMKVEVFGSQKRAYVPDYNTPAMNPKVRSAIVRCFEATASQLWAVGFTQVTRVGGPLIGMAAGQRGGLHCIAKTLKRSNVRLGLDGEC